jgi:hypothetical protein
VSSRGLAVLSAAALCINLPARANAHTPASASSWSLAVGRVCHGALLFDGRHAIGTEAGARAVARDIRASTERRLVRFQALRTRPKNPFLAGHWIEAERKLAGVYASSYLYIWRAIANADTRAERIRLPENARPAAAPP